MTVPLIVRERHRLEPMNQRRAERVPHGKARAQQRLGHATRPTGTQLPLVSVPVDHGAQQGATERRRHCWADLAMGAG
jgi:hypothetical protein